MVCCGKIFGGVLIPLCVLSGSLRLALRFICFAGFFYRRVAEIAEVRRACLANQDTTKISMVRQHILALPHHQKIEALAEIICRSHDESAAALLVLMATLENSTQPKVLANTAKHYAFTRCGELNLFGMVDAQIAVVESELFASRTVLS